MCRHNPSGMMDAADSTCMRMPYALRENVTDPLSFGVVDSLCVFNLS
jgi:hypothetical protein